MFRVGNSILLGNIPELSIKLPIFQKVFNLPESSLLVGKLNKVRIGFKYYLHTNKALHSRVNRYELGRIYLKWLETKESLKVVYTITSEEVTIQLIKSGKPIFTHIGDIVQITILAVEFIEEISNDL